MAVIFADVVSVCAADLEILLSVLVIIRDRNAEQRSQTEF
jgi:hypothetical protein